MRTDSINPLRTLAKEQGAGRERSKAHFIGDPATMFARLVFGIVPVFRVNREWRVFATAKHFSSPEEIPALDVCGLVAELPASPDCRLLMPGQILKGSLRVHNCIYSMVNRWEVKQEF